MVNNKVKDQTFDSCMPSNSPKKWSEKKYINFEELKMCKTSYFCKIFKV